MVIVEAEKSLSLRYCKSVEKKAEKDLQTLRDSPECDSVQTFRKAKQKDKVNEAFISVLWAFTNIHLKLS